MIIEFLIAYHRTADTEIVGVIRDCLAKVLEDNLNEFDSAAVDRMVIPSVERLGDAAVNDDFKTYHRALFGFALDLPEETASTRIVVDEFSEALNTSPIVHLVKFDDPLIRADLARWADEIYALEMKLRRVLTFVYLHAYQDGDPYELLREESVQPINKERPNPADMKGRAENQFFHLTFSQYVGLNRRPDFKLTDLLDLVRNKEAYDGFREELSRAPVEDEDDAVLLAGLKQRMDAIEAMRNCCAHSRRPSKKVEENYLTARPLLDQLLDGYLARWEWQEPIEESLWDRAAREAVEHAIQRANWDEETGQITLFDADDDRMRRTVDSREELDHYLEQVAASAFYANAPRADGDFLEECDEYGILESALRDYEERLEDFFGQDLPADD
jgi:hypothetical protein